MDVQSPAHLERFRARPEVKAVLFRLQAEPSAPFARFERTARNTDYWPPILALDTEFLAAATATELAVAHSVYQQPCLLLATRVGPNRASGYAIAMVAAEGSTTTEILALLRQVFDDYWHGSRFFK